MDLWTMFLNLLQAGLFVAVQACGGNLAGGIIVMSLAVRLTLLPLTYTIAREARRRAAILRKLQPALLRLRRRHHADPSRLAAEQIRLLRRHGLRLVDVWGLLGGIVQLPFVVGMYNVIRATLASGSGGRFLWIQNIARPDLALGLVVAALTYAVAFLNPQLQQTMSRGWMVIPVAVLTAIFLSKLSAGLGLYWGTTAAVGLIEALLLRRRRAAA
jgi:YidC/Oxa1 family membrane protein insertase